MSITTVLLVRHGQTQWNETGHYMGWIDKDLNEEGVWQAEQLSLRLKHWSIDSVYSSPLKRAYRTAQIVAASHSIEVSPLEGLGEIRVGGWEGLHRDEVKVKYPDIWQAWHTDPSGVQMPNGESMIQVKERAVAAFEEILEANRGCQVLLATHEVIVKLIVSHCLNISNRIYRHFEVANASLSIIRIIDGWYSLRLLNDISHLEGRL